MIDKLSISETTDELLDTPQAGVFLDTSPITLEIWRSTGRYNLPFVKVGRLVRYRRSDLIAWLKSRTRTAV